ncbi:MAG: PVC-type heme-binding CxxCH protein [Myxococcota bacterium]|nr:PVC-type heme-binding CxxCH protein [Myxococcota bacterium]
MRGEQLRRGWRLVSAGLIAVAFSGCLTRGMELPLSRRIPAEIYLRYAQLTAGGFSSEPDLPEGMTASVYAELDTTAVGLTRDARGDVYVAATDRRGNGISDNRNKPYWLLDDLAAEQVDDRRAYIESWAQRGKDPLSWYTTESDKVLRLRDTDGDGVADEIMEFAAFSEVLSGIGSSVLVHDGDVFFSCIPDLWRLRDGDGDGYAEERERLAHGFGVTTSLVGHDLHGLTWGPDGRIYFSIGDRGYNVTTREGRVLRPPMVVSRGAVFRMQPDGSELEVFATGLRNPQDLVFDDYGNLFTGDNNGDGVDEARLVYVMEGSDTGWAMSVQTMVGEYFHGPWEAERLWETQHAGQPAWVLPPVGYIGRGPAGAAIDPGLGGLPPEFRGKLLISDYQYVGARSGVRAYGVEPRGAGFELTSQGTLFGSILPTDLVFGADGRVYVSEFNRFQGGSRIQRFESAEHLADPRVAELTLLLREGFGHRESQQLAALLGHVDRRARRGAQHALATRGDAETLGAVARDPAATLLARIHALWGLGQLGEDGLRAAGIRRLEWTVDADPELRAQALRVAGEARASWLIPELIAVLGPGETPRVQSLALTALGKLQAKGGIGSVIELLRRNDDRDVFLRHAAVQALEGMEDPEAILQYANDASPAVRRAVLLVLRRHQDARVARFLFDPEPSLVVEAARAIHDLDLREALPALAALGDARDGLLPVGGDDPQTSLALHRRVISANLTLGGASNADRLALHAADERNPESMRLAALDALAEFTRPGPRDPVFGFYRELPERPESTVDRAIAALVPALVGGPYEARVLEIARSYDRVYWPDEELLGRVEGWFVPEPVKLESLRVLGERRSQLLGRALDSALDSRSPSLRAEARDILAGVMPESAVAEVRALSPRASLLERQRAQATLASVESRSADDELRRSLLALQTGVLDPAIQLEVVEAARRRSASLRDELAAYDASFASDDLVGPRRSALRGGVAERGRRVFEGAADCRRCHDVDGDAGPLAGPSLVGVGKRRDREFLLESLLVPQAEIAPGFGVVTLVLEGGETLSAERIAQDERQLTIEVAGERRIVAREEIVSQSERASAMPPTGLALSPRDLRDLIEYLSGL